MQVIRIVKKFIQILSSHQKLRIMELAVLMIIGGFLEMLSVSLILPFMDAVINPEETMGKWYVKIFCDILDLHSPTTFIVTLSFVLALVYILKNIYFIFETSIQYRFVYGNMFSLQSQLLDSFLHRPYEYYLGVDSGEIIRIVSTDTPNTFQLLITLLSFFSELVVSIILTATVFFMAPVVTLWMAVVLVVLMLGINFVLKPIQKRSGLATQKAYAGMNKWLLQAIQGAKEVKVMRRETYFKQNYDENGWQLVDAQRRHNTYSLLPRFLIEAVSMSAMFMVIGLMIYKGQPVEAMIPILTAVAMAAIRLLPAVNRMSAALSSMSYYEPMLDKLIENLQKIQGSDDISLARLSVDDLPGAVSDRRITGMKESLRLEDITYSYPTGDRDVLSGAELEIRPGESIGLVGASGAGKTTAVDVILGLLNPQGGRVLVDGTDIRDDMDGWLAQIGYIPQMIFMLDDNIRANVAFGMDPDSISDDDVWEALEEASLADFVRGLPDGLDTEIGERGVRLSGGQRQRIGIARALYLDPSILIFDEATSALDNETEKDIMESIDHLHGNKTIIIIAHRLTTIEACDRVYRVGDGKIVPDRKQVG